MFQALLWTAAAIWAVFLIQFILNALVIDRLGKVSPALPANPPFVSLVVPARNEERSVERAVTSFCSLDYPAFEVIVVNDGSTDRTGDILERLSGKFDNLKVIEIDGPSDGWLGKPFALETGKNEASGEWLLFADADVEYSPDLLRRAVSHVLKKDVHMLVLGPNFETRGIVEPAVLSMLYVAASICPFYLMGRIKSKRLAAGGGVFNMVKRRALEDAGAFESIRNAVIDDVALGCKVREADHEIALALAGDRIRIRMYHGARETIEGFMKNVYPGIRKHPWMLALPFGLGTLLCFLPYVGLAAGFFHGFVSIPSVVSLFLMHLFYAGIVLAFDQPWYLIFLCPVSEFLWWWITIRSFLVYRKKGVLWRGRRYDI